MSLFAELLWKYFPNIDFPGIDYDSITKLNYSMQYSSRYHSALKLIYYIYYLPYDNKKWYNIKSFKNKFQILDTIVLKNEQLIDDEKQLFFYKFSKAQNAYSALRKLVNIYRHKSGKKFEIDTDLCFNEFSKFTPRILISLVEDKVLYRFRLSDLVNIINRSLTNAPLFFAEPQAIKNPYTNIPFSLSNLYNIYFKLRETHYNMPMLFHQYFICNFDLGKFKNQNECYIRDKSIDNFVNNASIDERYQYIMRMFYTHYKSITFRVDPYFPREKLVSIFKNYLHSFLLEEYSLNPYVRETNKIQLEYNLTIFSQLNPDFGKKIWIRKRFPNGRNTYGFHDQVVTSRNSNNQYMPSPRTLTPTEYVSNISHSNNIDHAETDEETEVIQDENMPQLDANEGATTQNSAQDVEEDAEEDSDNTSNTNLVSPDVILSNYLRRRSNTFGNVVDYTGPSSVDINSVPSEELNRGSGSYNQRRQIRKQIRRSIDELLGYSEI